MWSHLQWVKWIFHNKIFMFPKLEHCSWPYNNSMFFLKLVEWNRESAVGGVELVFVTWSDVKYPASSHSHPYSQCPKGLQGDNRSGPISPTPMGFSLWRASFSMAIVAVVSRRRCVDTHHLLLLFSLEYVLRVPSCWFVRQICCERSWTKP
jgi:hypothetical protein